MCGIGGVDETNAVYSKVAKMHIPAACFTAREATVDSTMRGHRCWPYRCRGRSRCSHGRRRARYSGLAAAGDERRKQQWSAYHQDSSHADIILSYIGALLLTCHTKFVWVFVFAGRAPETDSSIRRSVHATACFLVRHHARRTPYYQAPTLSRRECAGQLFFIPLNMKLARRLVIYSPQAYPS